MSKGFRLKPAARAVMACCLIASPSVYAEGEHWVQRINMSGVVEAEYGSSEDYAGKKSSDITVATVEINIDGKVNDKVNAYVTLLHEEDDTPFSVDAAYIDVALGPVNVHVGAMGAPFGSFESTMLSDSLVLQIAETAESMLLVGTEMGPVQASVYMFNGDTQEKGGDDVADQHGARLAFVSEGDSSNIDIGIDYINNIADSDTIGGYFTKAVADGGLGTNEVKSYVPAQIIHANLSFGGFHLFLEHLVADKFADNEVVFKGKGAEITATNVELAYDLNIAGVETTIGIARQTTEQALALGMPKEKSLFSMSFGVYKFTALTFEYATSTDYDVVDGGTGKDATSYTLQLAIGF
ncbi:MAG: LbtU family siderophore porin [Gammaproteobacteria bacterium]|nr:LbtU family siderophore porin [Gammaproteobacteria bacterium]